MQEKQGEMAARIALGTSATRRLPAYRLLEAKFAGRGAHLTRCEHLGAVRLGARDPAVLSARRFVAGYRSGGFCGGGFYRYVTLASRFSACEYSVGLKQFENALRKAAEACGLGGCSP